MSDAPTPFRVHLADGQTIDVLASDPKSAREQAQERRPGAIIIKIKVIRES